jgi:hypothetical protein
VYTPGQADPLPFAEKWVPNRELSRPPCRVRNTLRIIALDHVFVCHFLRVREGPPTEVWGTS